MSTISLFRFFAVGLLWLGLSYCSKNPYPANRTGVTRATERKVGVLLVSHGSRSASWRKMLMDVENDVQSAVLTDSPVRGLKSAFMEYNEPSIASRLKEFDQEGFTDVVMVPILLTVSTHSFDDIPVIAGQREDKATLEHLKLEKIEVYHPKAKVMITPLLDFPAVLTENVVRRVKKMSSHPKSEGLVLVAYGDETYHSEWEQLIERIGEKVAQETGIKEYAHSWCGHIVHYQAEPTEKAIHSVLEKRERALVLPLLVAYDENFQERIIGGAVQKAGEKERITYLRDSILPDEGINRWVIQISREYAEKALHPTNDTARR
jgi:sirohydrochlorin ferrochelatase